MQNTTMPPPPPSHNPALLPFPPENPPKETKSPGQEPDDAAGRSDTVEVTEDQEERVTAATKSDGMVADNNSSSGRERLKRHRVEVAGRVWIPDMWGQEDFLKDWIDCAAFDAGLVNSSIVMARDSLMGERRRAAAANSAALRIHNGCN